MFADLDATLRAMLDDPGAPSPVRAAEVSFEPPDRDFTPGQATVNLFLHEVVENRTLRETAPFVQELAAGGFGSTPAPLRLDCTYLVTAWSSRTGAQKTEEEHALLGNTLLWLAGFATIEERFLQGALVGSQPYPLALTLAQTREQQPGLGEFWSALGVVPRPAFSVSVTLALRPVAEVSQFGAVTTVRPVAVSSTDPVLTGRVLDARLAAVPGAQVSVVEAGRAATADGGGRFSVAGLSFGRYTLRVVAGAHDQSRTVDYGPDSQVHDTVLRD